MTQATRPSKKDEIGADELSGCSGPLKSGGYRFISEAPSSPWRARLRS
jgi:hypothetical protein